MSATRRWIATAVPGAAALLLCALLFVPAAAGAPRGGVSPGSGADREEGLQRLHAAIEEAFERCESTPLKRAFSRRVKTLMSSRALGVRQGYYGADQVLLFLQRAFEGRATLRFKLVTPDDAPPGNARRALRARWLYRDEGASKSEARLSFALAAEGGDWLIREIRELK